MTPTAPFRFLDVLDTRRQQAQRRICVRGQTLTQYLTVIPTPLRLFSQFELLVAQHTSEHML